MAGLVILFAKMMKTTILVLMLALPVFAETNTLIERRLDQDHEVPEFIRRKHLARDRLAHTQNSDGSWGSDTNRVIETSIALLGFGDLNGHWRYQSNIVAGVHWLLSQPVPSEGDQVATAIIGLCEARRTCGSETIRTEIVKRIPQYLTKLKGAPRTPWLDLLAISDVPDGIYAQEEVPKIALIMTDYPMSTNSASLLADGDVRIFILRTLTSYGIAAGRVALTSLWSRQKKDGTFPPSDGCGEAATIGLMVRAYRPWVHAGYKYLYGRKSVPNKDLKATGKPVP